MKKQKRTKKVLIVTLSSIAAGLVAILVITPLLTQKIATSQLDKTFAEQTQPIFGAVNALMQIQGVTSSVDKRCYEVSHTYTEARLFCSYSHYYPVSFTSLPQSIRPTVMARSAELDASLVKNGWKIDDRQGDTQTIKEIVPTSPLEFGHVNITHYYKQLGDISCDLGVEFGGPADSTSLGVITITNYSCQQFVSHFMLHYDKHHNAGFGG